MLDTHTAANPLDDLEPVTDAAEVRKLIDIVAQVHVSEAVQQYAVALDHGHPALPRAALGASPRATLHLVRAAKALGRPRRAATTSSPTTSRRSPSQVLAHRLLPTVEASMSGRTPEAALRHIVAGCRAREPPRLRA